MTDIYDALLNGADAPVDNADLVARLRKQQSLGQLAQLSGIAGLQKMGPQLQDDAQGQALAVYKQRESSKDRAAARDLQASEASEREKDRMALGANASQDRALQRTLSQNMLDERLTAGQEKVSDAANAKAAAALEKNQTAYDGASDQLDRLAATATALKAHPGLGGITGVRGMVYNIPGTDAADAVQLLHTLKSQTTIDTMLALKNASKTGSTGFGQLSEAEGQKLQDSIAPLETAQSKESMTRSLDGIISYVAQAKKRLKEGLDRDAIGAAARASAGPTVTVTQGFKGGSALPLSRGAVAPAARTAPTTSLDDPKYHGG